MRPLKILKAVAFVNPFEESDRQFEDFIAARQAEREAEERFKKDNNALGFTRAAAPKCVRAWMEWVFGWRVRGFGWIAISRIVLSLSLCVSFTYTRPPPPKI